MDSLQIAQEYKEEQTANAHHNTPETERENTSKFIRSQYYPETKTR